MGDINGVWDELRDNWRLATAVLLVLLGFYLGARALATDAGGIVAISILVACCSAAFSVLKTQEWSELLEVGEKSVALGVSSIALLVSLVLNHPTFDLCRQNAYPC